MAGDWLKMEANTPEKGEVLAITARMGWDDADITVGKLFRLWRWFDQHTLDGNALRVTPALLDRIVGVSGFCLAVQEAGWLHISDEGVSLPKFDRHNGMTAKNRALTAKRVAKHKSGNAEGNDDANGKGNGDSVTQPLPREEKKREEEARAKDGAAAPIPVDPDKAMWDAGKALLGPSSGSLIGKLVKEHGKEAVMSAIAKTAAARPVEAKPYLLGILAKSEDLDTIEALKRVAI